MNKINYIRDYLAEQGKELTPDELQKIGEDIVKNIDTIDPSKYIDVAKEATKLGISEEKMSSLFKEFLLVMFDKNIKWKPK